jgi:hypothetical protein
MVREMRKERMDLDLVSGSVNASRSGDAVRNKVRHATAPKRNEEDDNMVGRRSPFWQGRELVLEDK